MGVALTIQQHKKKFITISIFLILLTILLIVFYFYRISLTPAPLPSTVGGDAPDSQITTQTQAASEFFLTAIFVILGIVFVGIFFFFVARVMRKTEEEHPELLQ